MNFDDFKKQFEIFTKIDTPEKLVICESQYKQHLLALEDENHFEPFEKDSNAGINSLYENNLKLILDFGQVTETQVSYMTMPSFEPESLLLIEDCKDKFILTHTVLVNNYWKAFYADNKVSSVDKTILTVELDKEIGNKIVNLFHKAISEARPAKSGRIVLDGVKYFLSCVINGKIRTVSKHSPNRTSKSGKVIDILELLTDKIMALNDDTLKVIETKINNSDK